MTSDATRTDVLRAIDKHDKLGASGVFDLLTTGRTDQSGAFTKGCGLSNGQAMAIIQFVESSNPQSQISARLALMCELESTVVDQNTGKTAWDMLLEMRPENIGWALDDIIEAIKDKRGGQ